MTRLAVLKRFPIGEPFANAAELNERMDRVRGLAIFASDPVSNNSDATDAIMSVSVIMGSGALPLTMPIAIALAAVATIVVFSYLQTIVLHPHDGGPFTVWRDNLGVIPPLFAAGALLTDCVLSVSVSTAAGARALTSAFPEPLPYRIAFAIAAILIVMWLNLGGVRESGTVFPLPTYASVAGLCIVIGIGLARWSRPSGTLPLELHPERVQPMRLFGGFAYV